MQSMLDTTSSEANDLIAAGHAEPKSSLAHQLALLANELRYERDQAEQQKDAALARAATAQTALENTFARLAPAIDQLAADNAAEQFLADGRGPYVGTDSVFDRAGWEQLKADVLSDEAEREYEERIAAASDYTYDTDRSLGLEYAGAV